MENDKSCNVIIEDSPMYKSLQKYLQKNVANSERAEKYIHFYNLAKEKGVVSFRLERIAEEYTDDYYADTGIDKADKEWFYERGIPTFKTGWYGLTKDNYNDYISDFDFYSPNNYLKSQFVKWFDYKLTTYYVISPFRQFMPRHYFYIQHGELLPVALKLGRYGNIEDVFSLLHSKPIALKACRGGHGKGFYKVTALKGCYQINNQEVSKQDVATLITSLDDYILTGFSIPHKVFRDACGEERFSVLRTVTVFDKEDGPQVTAILLRLGSSKTGLVSDYDGCINCGIDLASGKIFNPIMRSGDAEGILKRTNLKKHPDTGFDLESIYIPNFRQLVDLVKAVSSYLSMTPYLVMDIVPTDEGFEILEINSHGQVRILEPFFPFRKNRYNLSVFKTKDW